MQGRFVLGAMLILVIFGTRSASAVPPETTWPLPDEFERYSVEHPLGLEMASPYSYEAAVHDSVVVDRQSTLLRWWLYRAKPRLQYSHWGYPEFFEEMPMGNSVRAHVCTQIAMGLRERLVLYQYDFHENSTRLNRLGQRRLNDLAAAFPHWAQYRLVIEATPDHPQLAIARRNHVLQLLEASNVPARVEVDVPRSPMRQGDEVILMHQHLLRQLDEGAAPIQTDGRSGTNSMLP